jgi:hypothetical protein
MDTEIYELTPQARKYLIETRKLSVEALVAYRVGCNYRGEIAIPFYDQDETCWLIKNRAADGGMLDRIRMDGDTKVAYKTKTDCIPNGKPILLGSHLVQPPSILYICYGDYDAITLYGCGYPATSMPFGDRGINWIDKQWDWLNKFETIVFCPDYDEDEKVQTHLMKKLEEISVRLGKHKCWLIPEEAMLGLKDINELYIHNGQEAIDRALKLVVPVPEPGLSRLVDYHDSEFIEGTPLGISEVDKATGGHPGGLLTILSGDNNAGKTTLILTMIKNFIKEGQACFYWSGEQKPDRIRWWQEQVLAGPDYVDSKVSPKTGREYWFARPELVSKIRKWYANMIYVYDKRGIEPQQFFEVAELAVRRYGVTKIFIDNLMAFTGAEENYFQAQGDFAESCKNFAEDWNVHVVLVTHNKKIEKGTLPDKDSVEGSKKITNWADLVFQLIRINAGNHKDEYENANAILSLCKNRETEHLVDVRLAFDPTSKRIIQYTSPGELRSRVGWEEDKDLGFDF